MLDRLHPSAQTPDRLVIVPGHASFKESVSPLTPLPENVLDDDHWALAPFQAGEPRYYGEHIQHGIQWANEDHAELVFSGGRTRKESGPIWSEALSYYRTARHLYLPENTGFKPEDEGQAALKKGIAGIALEEFARDSFQNIEFPVLDFEKKYGTRPKHIKVVGWGFKEGRFRHHAATLGIPSSAFSYEGVNDPLNLDDAVAGEQKALEAFKQNPRGDTGELLTKRERRNPFKDNGPHDHRRLNDIKRF